jgi:hypothetical protein
MSVLTPRRRADDSCRAAVDWVVNLLYILPLVIALAALAGRRSKALRPRRR